MNRKDKLYYDLINAYRNHSYNDTLISTYVNKVLKLVKDYLDFDNLVKDNQELKNDIKLNETQIDDLTLEVANYKHALEEKNEIIFDLKKNS